MNLSGGICNPTLTYFYDFKSDINQKPMDIQCRITGEVYFVTDAVVDWVDVFHFPVINTI
jgi:hypothetical protein